MKASFWHELWEQGEIGFHKKEVDVHLERFWNQMGLSAGQRVFVPLCGKSLDMLWLAGAGHPVTGVELSPLAVEAFFDENQLNPKRFQAGPFEVWEADEIRILLGDVFDLAPHDIADCAGVYDRASLIALPPAMRADYARHLGSILAPGTQVLLLTHEYDQAKRAGPPFSVSEAEVRALYEPAYEVELLYRHDALSADSPLRQFGLTWMDEKVYRLVHC